MNERFDTILVANRGEIACRVLKTAADRGFRTVAVYTDPDANALHLTLADQAVPLGSAPAYLDPEALIDAAKRSGAGAIHPGYGFLSENAEFAEAVRAAGLVFVGPPPEAIRIMGDKRQAKLRMIEAGVPCVPGYLGEDQDLERLEVEAAKVGFPLMIKASAGGGGRGLRRVDAPESLRRQLELARAEAQSGFGCGTLILERAIDRARHVEVQVLADGRGQTVHLFERDCSVQRRHQKIIEEAPSPAVDGVLRERLGAAAVRAAEAVGYVGAGTVEMLLSPDGSFYFMEMNTRLQVEHPVTEMITGLDLVGLQLDVASGAHLPFSQADLRFDGHAIEARMYAEDPAAGFLPQVGSVEAWELPSGDGIRIDHGLRVGFEVTADYDPMLAKLIAHGRTRDEARRRLARALERTTLHGLACNQAFLIAALEHPEFIAGEADTGFVDAHLRGFDPPAPEAAEVAVAAALLATPEGSEGWGSAGSAVRQLELAPGGRAEVVGRPDTGIEVRVEGASLPRVAGLTRAPARVSAVVDGLRFGWARTEHPGRVELSRAGRRWVFSVVDPTRRAAAAPAEGVVRAPMAGRVVELRSKDGAAVAAGAPVLVLEAMKMQLEVAAPRGGIIHLACDAGAQVASQAVLARIEGGNE